MVIWNLVAFIAIQEVYKIKKSLLMGRFFDGGIIVRLR